MTMIESAEIRKILNSRGNQTIEVTILTSSGYGIAGAPSGASKGRHEVSAFSDKGIDFAIKNFKSKVAPKLIGYDAAEQEVIDQLLHDLDGTNDFSGIGGNIAVATSMAAAKAAASAFSLPLYKYLGGIFSYTLPRPIGNVLGGGRHAIGSTDIQEYLAISFAETVAESIFSNAQVHGRVKEKLKKRFPNEPIGKGDEGAWVAKISNEEAMEVVTSACDEISTELNFDIKPSLDFASTELFKDDKYMYKEKNLNQEEQIEFVVSLVNDFKLHMVEDPLHEDDFEGYVKLTKRIGNKCLIVGDDLFVTNKERLKKGIEQGCANSILIKPNQIGTLTDTLQTVKLAHENGYKTIISHRSGETTDETIAHLAVAFGCYGIKTGAVGGERIAKLNELIRIEDELGRGE